MLLLLLLLLYGRHIICVLLLLLLFVLSLYAEQRLKNAIREGVEETWNDRVSMEIDFTVTQPILQLGGLSSALSIFSSSFSCWTIRLVKLVTLEQRT